ncbi:hypothetical protein A6E15_05995 [Natrinema saccharevitans]|uniref:Uncharacterized protein n=1 Tax=Natrinema saccharevitans TaxID=301967 RepID=A0A1S8AVM6_9EURY|nr:hypothetical protein [Natrinema saccharevitans]OLZ40569.1 hypothetical protein A6E15_05995 [Natrinema saccharevitans]
MSDTLRTRTDGEFDDVVAETTDVLEDDVDPVGDDAYERLERVLESCNTAVLPAYGTTLSARIAFAFRSPLPDYEDGNR